MNFLQEVKNYGTERANVLKNRAVNLKEQGEKLVKQEDVEEKFGDDEEESSLDNAISLVTWIAWFFAVWVLWNCENIHFKPFLFLFLVFGWMFHDYAVWIPIAAALYAYFVQKCTDKV